MEDSAGAGGEWGRFEVEEGDEGSLSAAAVVVVGGGETGGRITVD